MQCEYCKNLFKNTLVLKRHQKTAGYCLKLRGEEKTLKLNCVYCDKSFSSKQKLSQHMIKCMENYEKYKAIAKSEFDIENSSLRKELKNKDTYIEKMTAEFKSQLEAKDKHIERLEDKLENIAIKGVTKSTTTNHINNVVNKLEPLTQEHMEDCAQFLTKKHIKDGPSGLAQYAVEFPFKDRIVCADFDRRKLKYKDEQGETVTDFELTILSKLFFNTIYDKSGEILKELNNEVYNCDNFDYEKTKKIVDTKMCIDDAVQGKKSDFSNKFVKEVCMRTVV